MKDSKRWKRHLQIPYINVTPNPPKNCSLDVWNLCSVGVGHYSAQHCVVGECSVWRQCMYFFWRGYCIIEGQRQLLKLHTADRQQQRIKPPQKPPVTKLKNNVTYSWCQKLSCAAGTKLIWNKVPLSACTRCIWHIGAFCCYQRQTYMSDLLLFEINFKSVTANRSITLIVLLRFRQQIDLLADF